MPLLDHFRPSVKNRVQWNSFYSNWATRLADQITRAVPDEYLVEEHLKASGGIEIDVAALRESDDEVARLRSDWQPPPPRATLPTAFPDKYEVLVFKQSESRQLVAAIELVSPRNKDRPAARRQFVAKVAGYLQQGVSVVLMDVVTTRRANLHNDLVRHLKAPADLVLTGPPPQYATAYRPVIRRKRAKLDIWTATFAVGDTLPTMPLRLIADYFVPVDFEAAYTEAGLSRRLI